MTKWSVVLPRFRILLFAAVCSIAGPEAKDRSDTTSAGHVQPAGFAGIVQETMDASSYTYVKINAGKDTIWAAGPKVALKVGDSIRVPAGVPMNDYQSTVLKRTFKLVYFVDKIDRPGVVDTGSTSLQLQSGMHSGAIPPHSIDFSGIRKAKGGFTIAEIYAKKNKLAGKKVRLRARVVKSNQNIMEKTWLHVQDGTGHGGSNDLVVSTITPAVMGDIVLVHGLLVKDKSLGHGYNFKLLVENADVMIETASK